MPHYRERERKKHQQRWTAALAQSLTDVRRTLRLEADEVVPDAVLLLETENHFQPSGLAPPIQWFGLRLMRMADCEAERDELLTHLRTLRPGPAPWGANGEARSPHRSRRPQTDAAKRA